jgi:hypothetical protein
MFWAFAWLPSARAEDVADVSRQCDKAESTTIATNYTWMVFVGGTREVPVWGVSRIRSPLPSGTNNLSAPIDVARAVRFYTGVQEIILPPNLIARVNRNARWDVIQLLSSTDVVSLAEGYLRRLRREVGKKDLCLVLQPPVDVCFDTFLDVPYVREPIVLCAESRNMRELIVALTNRLLALCAHYAPKTSLLGNVEQSEKTVPLLHLRASNADIERCWKDQIFPSAYIPVRAVTFNDTIGCLVVTLKDDLSLKEMATVVSGSCLGPQPSGH